MSAKVEKVASSLNSEYSRCRPKCWFLFKTLMLCLCAYCQWFFFLSFFDFFLSHTWKTAHLGIFNIMAIGEKFAYLITSKFIILRKPASEHLLHQKSDVSTSPSCCKTIFSLSCSVRLSETLLWWQHHLLNVSLLWFRFKVLNPIFCYNC